MTITSPTRREAGTPPKGGVFLPIETLVSPNLVGVCKRIDELKVDSKTASAQLAMAIELWEEDQSAGRRHSYQSELGRYAARAVVLDERIKDDIERIESLKDKASDYGNAQSQIRLASIEVGRCLMGKIEIEQFVTMGDHTYGKIVGPCQAVLLSRREEDRPDFVFGWDGNLDGVRFVHSTFREQIDLINDAVINAGLSSNPAN